MDRTRIVAFAFVGVLLVAVAACEMEGPPPQAREKAAATTPATPAAKKEAPAPAAVAVPKEVGGFTLVPLNGVEARIEAGSAVDGKLLAKVSFVKKGDERRLLALLARPEGDPATAKALAVRYRVALAKGEAPRLALAVFEKGGTAWYRVGGTPLALGESAEGRLPLGTLRQAEFSKPTEAEPAKPGMPEPTVAWGNVEKIWIGIVIDGPAEGTLEIGQARYTSEPYRPAKALRVTGDGPGAWTASADTAVKSTLTTPSEGPGGKPCMKLEFKFPGRRHMFATPSTPVLGGELEGYSALRFTYKATLPAGIKGLLVTVGERGGAQYYADPAPPANADWTTITIPFDKMKLASWTKDANGKLDVDLIERVLIGAHGTAAGDGGSGIICAADVEFVP